MDNLAHAFDQPIESQEHQLLASTAWMGGAAICVRYWLGRALRRNLFRAADGIVKQALREYLVAIDCQKGAGLSSNYQAWGPISLLLQHQVEEKEKTLPAETARLAAAVRALMADPELTDSQVAAIAKTTEKQIGKMSDVSLLRSLWKRQPT